MPPALSKRPARRTAHHVRNRLRDRHSLADTSQIVGATDNSDWRSNVDLLKKLDSEISRHPHASVRRWVSWKVSSMHPDRRAEFHKVRHGRGFIMVTPMYRSAGSRIGVHHSAGSVDD